MLPTIRHDDIGRPSEPGHYDCSQGIIRVETKHIAAWAAAPDAAFRTILCTRLGDTGLRFDLGEQVAA